MSLAEASLGLPVGGSVHRHTRSCRRARGRQGRFAPLKRWPEGGPSLTAAARAGMSRVQVGTEGWCRSNKRIEPKQKTAPQNGVKITHTSSRRGFSRSKTVRYQNTKIKAMHCVRPRAISLPKVHL